MANNFAPYQDSPEVQRALSPPVPSPRPSLDRTRSIGTAAMASPSLQAGAHNNHWAAPQQEAERVPWSALPGSLGNPREDVDMFETRLGIRMDYEACLAYLLLPPAGGVLLLILEHRSDYVRFHAWQSSLLFAYIFVSYIVLVLDGAPD